MLVTVGAGVGLSVGVQVGVGVWVNVGLAVGLVVRVAVTVGLLVAVGVGVLVGVQVALGVGVELGLGSVTVGVGSPVPPATRMGLGPGVSPRREVTLLRVGVGLEVAYCACGASDPGRRIKKRATSRTRAAPPIISKVLGTRPCFTRAGGETSVCSSSTAAPVAIL